MLAVIRLAILFRILALVAVAMVALAVLAACGDDDDDGDPNIVMPTPLGTVTPGPGPTATPVPTAPGPTATAVSTATAAPTATPGLPATGPTATLGPGPTATPVPEPTATLGPGPTATPGPGPTATPVPTAPGPTATAVPSPPPTALATSIATPGTQERELHLSFDRTVKIGESAIIEVAVTLPERSVSAPGGLPDYVVTVVTPDEGPLEIYFKPPNPTLLTLTVTASKFTIDYAHPQIQQLYWQQEVVNWKVTITPKEGAAGQQDVTITLTQKLLEGEGPIPPEVGRSYSTAFEIEVKKPFFDPDKSIIDEILDILKWVVPGGLAPLIAAFLARKRIGDFIKRRRSGS